MRKIGKLAQPAAMIFLLAASVIALSCEQAQPAVNGGLTVAVTILPQREFVERLGGDRVEVVVMVPPGADPHTYEVKPDQMMALSKADMYAMVGSGLPFELVWMPKLKAVNKKMLVVDCSQGIKFAEIDNGDEHGQAEGLDTHIWLSVRNAKVMVENIHNGLVRLDAGGRAYYQENRNTYLAELSQLDENLEQSLSVLQNRTFMVFHPAFGYFAGDYNLRQLAVEQGGKEPTADYMVRLIDEAKAAGIKVVFVSIQFNRRSAEIIAGEIGGSAVTIDPLAENYVENMRHITQALKGAMD